MSFYEQNENVLSASEIDKIRQELRDELLNEQSQILHSFKERENESKVFSNVKKVCRKLGLNETDVFNNEFLQARPVKYGASNSQIVSNAALADDDETLEDLFRKSFVKKETFNDLVEEQPKTSSAENIKKEQDYMEILNNFLK